jgi:endo-1,4-beta-xylanase
MKSKYLFISVLPIVGVFSLLVFNEKNDREPANKPEVQAVSAVNAAAESKETAGGGKNMAGSTAKAEIANLKEEDVADNKTVKTDSPEEQGTISLKDAYKNYFPIGAAADPEPTLFLNSSAGRNFIASQFSSITPGNSMKMKRIQPTEGNFDFARADQTVAFAIQNHMKIRGHCLIWSAISPTWFLKDGLKNASKELIFQRMKTHITTVMNRYKGKVYCWDVVNEAVSRDAKDGIYKQDLMYKICGPEYIEKAFIYAHQADPNAILFYNDQGFEIKEKRDRIYTLLKNLKAKGIPVSGVGMQGHYAINDDPESILRENIKMFSGLGLQIQITELDVSIYNRGMTPQALANVDDKYAPAIQSKQAAIFDEVFRVCRENKGKVTGITLWIPADGVNYMTIALKKKNYPSLFDENFKPKMNFKRVTSFQH